LCFAHQYVCYCLLCSIACNCSTSSGAVLQRTFEGLCNCQGQTYVAVCSADNTHRDSTPWNSTPSPTNIRLRHSDRSARLSILGLSLDLLIIWLYGSHTANPLMTFPTLLCASGTRFVAQEPAILVSRTLFIFLGPSPSFSTHRHLLQYLWSTWILQ
jgi:hypothetical protein